MPAPKTNGNKDPFAGKKVKYPVSYPLKVITTNTKSEDAMKEEIHQVLDRLKIPNRDTKTSLSKKGTYISFTIFVTLINENTLRELYKELASIPEIKMAV